jgi:hypothetical protein
MFNNIQRKPSETPIRSDILNCPKNIKKRQRSIETDMRENNKKKIKECSMSKKLDLDRSV